jgi:hypothetical protein
MMDGTTACRWSAYDRDDFNLRYPLNETFGTTPKGGDKLKSMPVLTVGENHPSVFDKACT